MTSDSGIGSFTYCAPFDDEDGDLIICSSDDVLFRVHKDIICKSSPVMKSMLRDEADSGSPQTMCLPDDSAVIELALRLSYPSFRRQVLGINSLRDIVDFCTKYNMEGTDLVSKRLARFFDDTRQSEPLRTYALAWKARLEHEVRKAALECLYHPITYILRPSKEAGQDLAGLPPIAFHDLLFYYYTCSQLAASVAQSTDFQWAGPEFRRYSWSVCKCSETPASFIVTAGGTYKVHVWWKLYMERLGSEFSRGSVLSRNGRATPCSWIPCTNCASRNMVGCASFVPKLLEHIESLVRKVRLEINFKPAA